MGVFAGLGFRKWDGPPWTRILGSPRTSAAPFPPPKHLPSDREVPEPPFRGKAGREAEAVGGGNRVLLWFCADWPPAFGAAHRGVCCPPRARCWDPVVLPQLCFLPGPPTPGPDGHLLLTQVFRETPAHQHGSPCPGGSWVHLSDRHAHMCTHMSTCVHPCNTYMHMVQVAAWITRRTCSQLREGEHT